MRIKYEKESSKSRHVSKIENNMTTLQTLSYLLPIIVLFIGIWIMFDLHMEKKVLDDEIKRLHGENERTRKYIDELKNAKKLQK